MNANFKSSSEVSELMENDNQHIDITSSVKEIQKRFFVEEENSHSKQAKFQNQDTQFSNILSLFKRTNDSSHDSEIIAERSSSFHCLSVTDIVEDEEDEAFSHSRQQISFDREATSQTPPKILNRKAQVFLSIENEVEEQTDFNEIEERIYNWLDSRGIKQVSPDEKRDLYYQNKRRIVSTQILLSSYDLAEEPTMSNFKKQSLLDRRKQNINIRKTTLSPQSCFDLERSAQLENNQLSKPALFALANIQI